VTPLGSSKASCDHPVQFYQRRDPVMRACISGESFGGLEHALRHKLVKPGDIGLIISVAQDSRSGGQPITSDAGSLTPKRRGRCSLGGFPRGNDRREYRGRGGECSIRYCL
jgi:hypothetical protein